MVPNQVLPQVPYTGTCGRSSYQPLTLNAPSRTAVRLITLQTSLFSFKHKFTIVLKKKNYVKRDFTNQMFYEIALNLRNLDHRIEAQ